MIRSWFWSRADLFQIAKTFAILVTFNVYLPAAKRAVLAVGNLTGSLTFSIFLAAIIALHFSQTFKSLQKKRVSFLYSRVHKWLILGGRVWISTTITASIAIFIDRQFCCTKNTWQANSLSKTSSKRISTSKCDICILKLILTVFVQQNYWHFWMRVGSILFVLQNSWHFQMMEEYDRIYLFVFCLSFGNSLGIFNLQSRQFA